MIQLTPEQTRAYLEATLAILRKDGWYATQAGNPAWRPRGRPRARTLVDAIEAVTPSWDELVAVREAVVYLLRGDPGFRELACSSSQLGRLIALVRWNDQPGRKASEVRELLQAAIQRTDPAYLREAEACPELSST